MTCEPALDDLEMASLNAFLDGMDSEARADLMNGQHFQQMHFNQHFAQQLPISQQLPQHLPQHLPQQQLQWPAAATFKSHD